MSINDKVSSAEIVWEEEEKRIARIITKIDKNRNRAGYQNILVFAKRENKDLEMDIVEEIIKGLIDKNIIRNIGKDEINKESFKIVETDGSHSEDKTHTEIQADVEDGDELVENYINDKFIETLKSMINSEVNSVFYEQTQDFNKFNLSDKITKECNRCDNKSLVDALKEHNAFLQKELQSKDTIIKMLINDRSANSNVDGYNNANSNDVNLNNCDHLYVNKTTSSDDVNKLNISKKATSNVGCNNFKRVSKNDDNNNNNINGIGIHAMENGEDQGFRNVKKAKKPNERTIAIIGDSLIKDVDPFEIRKKLNNKNNKVYRHNFNGAKINAMKYHSIPVMEFNPDLAILHVGTNSLRSMDTEEKIAEDILSLANSIKKDTNEIIVSSIIARRDQFKEKAEKVNDFLYIKCKQLDIPFIRHNNIRSEVHLKPKGVHLNFKGSDLLSDNFAKWINT